MYINSIYGFFLSTEKNMNILPPLEYPFTVLGLSALFLAIIVE